MPFTTVMFSFSSDSKETRRVLLLAPIVTPSRHRCACATTQRSSVSHGHLKIALRTNRDDRGPHESAPVRPPHFLSMTQRKTWPGDWTQILFACASLSLIGPQRFCFPLSGRGFNSFLPTKLDTFWRSGYNTENEIFKIDLFLSRGVSLLAQRHSLGANKKSQASGALCLCLQMLNHQAL